MKTNKFFAMAAALTLSCGAVLAYDTGQLTFDAGSQTVPDANPLGLTLSTNLTGIAGNISSVTVSLDITGGFNGDLYAYVEGPNGNLAVLLNRVGVGTGNSFGYSDAGFNITFDDSAAADGDIHFYHNVSNPGGGQLTGSWMADGRSISPNSSASLFDATPSPTPPAYTLLGSAFDGSSANGEWTLFLADLSSGGQSTVVSWGVDITTVPEPSTLALLGLGGAVLLISRRSRMTLLS